MLKNSVRTKVRIGKICYTNCLPFYHQLKVPDTTDPEFYETYPSRLNRAMRKGRVDLGPISSLEYLNHQKKYFLLPKLAIGSRDFSGSVILFSRERIEGLNHAGIALTRHSLSSAALLKILLKFKYKFKNRFVPVDSDPEKALLEHKAALAIGDDALFSQLKGFAYKYDLSELWWNWTGKPFCFAVWAVRRTFAEEYPEEVVLIARELCACAENNLIDIETLLKDALGMSFLDPRFPKVFGYLFNLSFKLDPSMQEGLELFFRLAARLGISPQLRKLEFFGKD